MGRPERPLAVTASPIVAFAYDLRALRVKAGNPSYRQLAQTALFAPSVLSSAASGHRLPTLAVTLAFVSACGGDRASWEARWREVAAISYGRTNSRYEVVPATDAADPVDAVRPPPASPGGGYLGRPAQLPLGPSTFVGRVGALSQARRLIGLAGSVRTPLLVSGPIGVGKTAFALRLAGEVCAEFPDGQLYADLGAAGAGEEGGQSVDGIVSGFLRGLGVPPHLMPDGPAQRIGLYRSLLAQRRLLVLMTNVRDESQARPLLGQAVHSQVVLTSRARLLGLADVHRIELGTFSRQESMTLLARFAGTARVRGEYEATDAIAELCEDLPLAVNIVARRVAARPEWSIAYTASQLTDSGRLLDQLSIGDVSVRDRLAPAYQLLSPAGKMALRLLGRTGDGWTTAIGLAAALDMPIEAADELLESLVDGGLVRRGAVAGRYSVSGVVRAFAAGLRRDRELASVPTSGGIPARAEALMG